MVFAFIALAIADVVLVLMMPGINYAGADGKAAQAEILITLEFARPFDVTNLNPLQGLGSQLMPMNVWVNPAYWPFAFFDKEVAHNGRVRLGSATDKITHSLSRVSGELLGRATNHGGPKTDGASE